MSKIILNGVEIDEVELKKAGFVREEPSRVIPNSLSKVAALVTWRAERVSEEKSGPSCNRVQFRHPVFCTSTSEDFWYSKSDVLELAEFFEQVATELFPSDDV